MMKTKLCFSIPSYEYLQKEICALLKFELGKIESRHFLDGERYLRILEEVQGRDVLLIGGTIHDAATLDLYDIASGLVNAGARSLTLFIPFLGYSTMERAVKPGEVVTAKTRAKLLSSIPKAPFGNFFVLLDLHSEGLPFYFEDSVTPVHLYAKSIILREARSAGGDNFSLGCVDAGRAKWVESLANDLAVSASFVYKRRLSGESTTVTAISASVQSQNVVIYDDMIRTGGSILQAAEAYLRAGANEISLITTHGLFSDDGLEKIRACGSVKRVISTNSHPNSNHLSVDDGFLKVISVAEIYAAFEHGLHFDRHA